MLRRSKSYENPCEFHAEGTVFVNSWGMPPINALKVIRRDGIKEGILYKNGKLRQCFPQLS